MTKATTDATHFDSVTPRIPVTDIDAALAFYCDQLGFQLAWKWGTPLTHAGIYHNEVSLDLILLPAKAGTAMVYIRVSGVDAYYASLHGREVNLTLIDDRPYGLRDFEVIDPWGNRLAFGQVLDDE
ncbi:MAG TPA: glyoxalase superfamily protein [Candidatus Acidoferrum sp.]|nr:glyoxalase superfamily protein [Candidatus Acidoferrum sp.]